VVVFAVGVRKDTLASQIRDSVERYVVLPHHLPVMRETILDQHVDVLFYPDIGMHPITYFLALSRLAPVQCVSWGHPVTTGLDRIDYFLSSADLEPDDAEEHYTESLVRLSALPTYYYRPPLPEPPRDRTAFGLSEQENLYLCPQSLFKFHPDFDAILVDLLRRDPQGRLILLEGGWPHWTALLLERWHKTLADVIDRVSFLPRLGEHDFLSLIMLSDVLLDPVHFGGGNTTYEAFAMGTPIVTQPGRFMRGRVTHACYKKMGLHDCVASTPEEYVDIAVRLGTDRDYRKAVSAAILSRNHILYEDLAAVKELEQFFLRVLQQAYAKERDA
jgi:predicted O-linked N-acetylglucosamine transferase (SPINDLY family)